MPEKIWGKLVRMRTFPLIQASKRNVGNSRCEKSPLPRATPMGDIVAEATHGRRHSPCNSPYDEG